MPNQDFDSAKYRMTGCPHCQRTGYIRDPQKHPCPICRGFGYLREESHQFKSINLKPGPWTVSPTR
jgi:DnaJ-class molecular chaperone